MADDQQVQDVLTQAIPPVNGNKESDDLTLEALVLLINTERLKYLQEKTLSEFKTLKERQDKVGKLQSLLKSVNNGTDAKGELDWTENADMQKLLKEAQDHGVNFEKQGKKPFKFSREERDRLVENIRMTVDDMNVLNDMQLQTITRLTNERYESYQMARSILKPLHDDKVSKARALAGR